MTSDWVSSASSSRAQPRDLYCPAGISVYALRGNDVLVLPTSGVERSAIKIEGYARNDDAREALSKLRGASDFYAPHHHSSLLTPHF